MVRYFGSVADQPWFLPVLLVAVASISSWEFACITPFVAFAVAASYALSTRSALFTVTGVWLANQAVGFAVLGYPRTADTMLWGLAIGAAALMATGLACLTLRSGVQNKIAAVGGSFVVALGAYQGGLFLAILALGGRDAFTPAIVGHVALLSFGWTVALVGSYEILRYTGAMSGSEPSTRSVAARF
jgi:hypothetical protein